MVAYYSTLKKNEPSPEIVTVSEIKTRKQIQNTAQPHVFVESKTADLLEGTDRVVVMGD